MKFLFIDTSSNILTIALIDNNNVMAKISYDSNNEHSRYAMLGIEKAFADTKMGPNDIDKIMVVNGPGSFTGIRIGVTIAKVYAWALKKKVIPVSSLKSYALSNHLSDYYVAVIDARRQYVYAGIYDKDYNEVMPEKYISIKELNDFINTLNGSVALIGDIKINDRDKMMPIKLDILKIVEYYNNEPAINAYQLNPNYLKRVEAEEKLIDDNVRG